jgi:hypothetical protein
VFVIPRVKSLAVSFALVRSSEGTSLSLPEDLCECKHILMAASIASAESLALRGVFFVETCLIVIETTGFTSMELLF